MYSIPILRRSIALSKSACLLDEVTAEWSQANIALIRHVLKHGQELLEMEGKDLLGEPEGSA